MTSKTTVEAYGDWLKETEKAILFRHHDLEEEFWIPKSVIANLDDYEEGDEDITLEIEEWFAVKEGM
jgi:hypothetical protein